MGTTADPTAGAAATARPAARALPTPAPRAPTSAASHLPEIAVTLEQVRRAAIAVDESRVRRSYRNWLNWLTARGRKVPILVAILPGERWAEFAAELGLAGGAGDEALFELCGDEVLGRTGRPWARLPIATLPQELSLLVIRDPALFTREWDAAASLRRDCALAIDFGSATDSLSDLFERLALGLVSVTAARADAVDSAPARRSPTEIEAGRFTVELPPDAGLLDTLALAVPPHLLESMRAAIVAHDLVGIGAALQAEEEGGPAITGLIASAEGSRARRSEADQLALELERIVGARNDFATEVKTVLNSLRQVRNEIETGAMVEEATATAFRILIARFDPSSEEALDNLVTTTHKRTWWEGTRFSIFRPFFSKRSEAQLDREVLNAALADVERTSLRWLGKVTVESVAEFNRAVDSVGLSYFGAASPLATHRAEKVFADNFVVAIKPPPGGAAPMAAVAKKMVEAAQGAFRGFSGNEVRTFRIDREKRGLIAQVTEARAAIFGIYFILLLALRVMPKVDCESAEASDNWFNQVNCAMPSWLNLPIFLMGLIVIGFAVNIFSHPRQERAALADKVETKLEELRSRLTAFLDRFHKDQLSYLETSLSDSAAAIDATLERRRATVQAKLDSMRVTAATIRPERSTVLRPVQYDDLTRKLHAKVSGDFQTEYAAQLGAV